MNALLALALSLVSSNALAAPFPATSGAVIRAKPGLFLSDKGFSLNSAQTAWVLSPPPKHIRSLVTVYRSQIRVSGEQPALTVRVDDLRKNENMRGYVKRWMKDYARFGFEVLTAKPVKVGLNQAFLLDIVSRETQKQLRQVVFIKNKTAVILTCRDGRQSFQKTVQDCNEITKTFAWD